MRTGEISGVIQGDELQVCYDSGVIGKGNLLFNGNFESWQGVGLATPNMTSATAPSGVVSASSESGAYYGWLAFDGVTTGEDNIWKSTAAPSGGSPQWIKYAFDNGITKTILSYTVKNRVAGGNINSPNTWTFDGSNNNSTWTTLHTVTNDTDNNSGTVRTYTCSATGAYRYYRLNITARNGADDQVCICEITMIPAAPDGWTLAGAGATIAREGTIKKIGTYSAKVVSADVSQSLYVDFASPKGIAYWRGKTLYMGCWVYATTANTAAIRIADDVGATLSSYHTGDSTWQWLTVSRTIPVGATVVDAYCWMAVAGTAYFDGAILMESAVPASNTDTSYFDQTSISVTGLDGDNDDTYEIYSYIVNGYDGAVNYNIRPNNDSATNYGRQKLYGNNTNVTTDRATNATGLYNNLTGDLGYVSFSNSTIYAKSGYVRTAITKIAMNITGTTVDYIWVEGQSWNNTADNITTATIVADKTNGIGIGSRIIILRRNSLTSGSRTGVLDVQGQLKGCWQTVYKTTLAAAATSVSITGLDGDTGVMYRLRVRAVGGADGVGVWYTLNNIATGYGMQILYNDDDHTPAAIRQPTATETWLFRKQINTGELLLAESLIYAKSGNVRTMISEVAEAISTTTVTTISLFGQAYGEAATNITSIVLSSQTNGLGIGTVISLDAYRPQ